MLAQRTQIFTQNKPNLDKLVFEFLQNVFDMLHPLSITISSRDKGIILDLLDINPSLPKIVQLLPDKNLAN